MNSGQQMLSRRFDYVPEFEVKGVFGQIANRDFDRAVQLAHGFQREAVRANSTIAICQSVLKAGGTRADSISSAAAKN